VFEKNEQEVSQIIEENLEELLSRKISIEEVLRQHPRHAADLRRELEPAIWLASHRECVQPRPGFIPASRKRVAERVKEEAFSREGKRPGLALARPSRRLAFQIVAVFLIAALLLGGVSGAVSAAQNALPGEQWYGVKRFGESVAFHLAINDVRRVELEMQLVGRRLDEVEALVAASHFTYVEETLRDYSSGLGQAVAGLEQLGDTQPAEKLLLGEQLYKDLLHQAGRLDRLALSAPQELRGRFIEARDLSLSSAAGVLEREGREEDRFGATPTGAGSPSAIPTATATLKLTRIPAPGLENAATKKAERTGEAEPTIKEKKATNTPRPTNVNRPTQQVTKEPKPPKDKPTKTEK